MERFTSLFAFSFMVILTSTLPACGQEADAPGGILKEASVDGNLTFSDKEAIADVHLAAFKNAFAKGGSEKAILANMGRELHSVGGMYTPGIVPHPLLVMRGDGGNFTTATVIESSSEAKLELINCQRGQYEQVLWRFTAENGEFQKGVMEVQNTWKCKYRDDAEPIRIR